MLHKGNIRLLGLIGVLIICIISLSVLAWDTHQKNEDTKKITSYESCKAAGYPIQESFPERCSIPGGKSYTNESTASLASGTTVKLTGVASVADTSRFMGGSDAIYKVTATDAAHIEVRITAGDPSCDEEAVKPPSDVVPGDTIEVSAKKTDDGFLRVCDNGTFVKKVAN